MPDQKSTWVQTASTKHKSQKWFFKLENSKRLVKTDSRGLQSTHPYLMP